MRYLQLPAASFALILAAGLILPGTAGAQSKDYFVPHKPVAPRHHVAPKPRPAPVTPPAAGEQPVAQLPMPPVPELPALPKGASPPAAVIGVIGVPAVMRGSVAAKEVREVLGARRKKLEQDAQKEQDVWRKMQQALADDRGKLSKAQMEKKVRELQERITKAQKGFRERNRIIEEATQYALNQIQATLIAVIRQVSESRGMNLVLHRSQVALNVNEFDITDEVIAQLNKLLPTVKIPPDGVEPPKTAPNAPVVILPPPPPKPPAAPPAKH